MMTRSSTVVGQREVTLMRRRSFLTELWVSLSVTVVGLFIVSFVHAAALPIQEVDGEIEKAVLSEDWAKVADLAERVSPETPSPVLKLIKGHAALALNRNNESLCLFLSASSKDDLQKWERWTQDFAKKYPQKAIASYFRGDALARLEQWEEALQTFTKALQFHPGQRLILNARGVTYAMKGQFAQASNDFEKAAEPITRKLGDRSALADAHANLGMMQIQKRDGAAGAKKEFTKALAISPDFALAYLGRGNILLVEKEDPASDFKKAEENGSCAALLIAENTIRITASLAGGEERALEDLIADLKTPGTFLEKSFDKLSSQTTQDFGRARALRTDGMKWLPFREHVANFFENRGFEKLERMNHQFGPDSVTRWANQSPPLTVELATKTTDRVQTWNSGTGRAIGETTSMTGTAIAALGGLTGPTPTRFGAVTAGLGMDATGRRLTNWSDTHTQQAPVIRDALQKATPTGSSGCWRCQDTPIWSQKTPGGVDAGMPAGAWEDGNWPFVEYYGLLYGVQNKRFLGARGEGQ